MKVITKTGDVQGAGTDANIKAKLHSAATESDWFALDNSGDDFERGDVEGYNIKFGFLGGDPVSIEIQSDDSGVGSAWYLERVWVVDLDDYENKRWTGVPGDHWFRAESTSDSVIDSLNQTIKLDPYKGALPKRQEWVGVIGGVGYTRERDV
ncbi:PLAT/LH2 domain-containing protein [Nocardia arthritidis]|uniref:PLAT domain-containing protein n=1 Tax=Nocardia arthritidis TaxID=228602 RepID=A0A6G9YBI3_9NOCA|nr:PLAT/LH2 domain-containing protein [Nocardia arthritidis]QIS10589.1 hypothetical protein F5544_13500 [Nocardia arthritidis]